MFVPAVSLRIMDQSNIEVHSVGLTQQSQGEAFGVR